ncbi:MAG: leucine--tRNA ligase [Elusimicrobiota bacterium]|jgi:leucyl-tRNA synthetase|nr:leucine--tRNA ligase [Elusimicrobiota bacterium]
MDYNFKEIEAYWQKEWEDKKVFRATQNDKCEKFYCLEMLPYPSGVLHMGHVRNYSLGDVLTRYYIMKGRNVLHPMGWDSFGMPAENAAIKNKIHPAKWTKQNIAQMRAQLKSLGFAYDWEREIATSDPHYYKWNQWFFIKMWEQGLVFRKKANVNWCPTCQTVLANEQVSEGVCWRCKNPTQHKELEQWFIKITDYSDKLLDGLKELEGKWPPQVISMQKNWIGKSVGAEVDFEVVAGGGKKDALKIFTTRPDTLFGVTFMVVAPEHPIIKKFKNEIKNFDELEKYIKKAASKTNIERSQAKEKTGVKIEGLSAINPANSKEIPIFAADYVLTDYGTGAIMAVPGHDQRDWDFAKAFNAPIIEVIKGENSSVAEAAFEGDGKLVNSNQFNGLATDEGIKEVIRWIEKEGFGKRTINYKFRDWLISRQRYWGTPIPMVHCKKCGTLPVNLEDLPIVLPEDVEFTGEGESPLKKNSAFVNTKCPKCGAPAKRETDTMDTFVDSSWYFLRYTDAHNDKEPFKKSAANFWMSVDQYIGGIEHACMHLIYSRFWYKFLHDLKLVKNDEPFINLLTQGMVTLGGVAMSKSRGNIVSPDEIISKYGADTARLFILFAAPPQKQLEWSADGVEGSWRFLNRVWRLVEVIDTLSDVKADQKEVDFQKENLLRLMHKTIKKVSADIETKLQFNTAISSIMELVNALYSYKFHVRDGGVSKEVYKNVLLLMAPFSPHLCEQVWKNLGYEGFISKGAWPEFDEKMIKDKIVEIPVQINAKVRGKILIPQGAGHEEVKKLALENERIQSYIEGKEIIKFIYIENKIVTLVIR